MTLPVVVFDTSALGFLIKDDPCSEPYLKALTCGFDIWLTGMTVGEIIATPMPATREQLSAGLQRLLVSGRCLWPPHEILTLLCSAHSRDPKAFDWRGVDVRAKVYERAIIDRDFPDDLPEAELAEQLRLEEEFMEFWRGLRTALDPVLGPGPANRPRSYRHAAEIARTGKVLGGLGKPLYERGSGTSLGDIDIKAFMDVCPPFRALCYGLVGSWYDVSLATQVFKKLPGRNDHMMAVYLPYCSRFVTADGKQEARLRDVVAEAKLDCEVLSYTNFLASFEALA